MKKGLKLIANLPIISLLLMGLFITSSSQASSVYQLVTAKKINQGLQTQFPVIRSFKGISATFSEPEILINVLDKNIKLMMTVTSGENPKLIAKIRFKGNLKFDSFTEAYQFEDLYEDKFSIESNTFDTPEPIIKAIKQSLINSFDDIVLFNLDEINGFAPKREADEIVILAKQLKFVWY
ncbi:MAG: hypothetical protein ABJK64_05245 [Paraglaciecola sp.]|uniref:hypothetical protein n=1 Tax=Paraglaciecola sp. TaxID=1920173 RepID=UPI00329825A8